ncbi:MAG TPA: glycosyltransferase family 61 protein [Nocardioides sp.]|nr:glycosyltransferase family 61 protein [Nocardioides sp.]
MGGGEPPAELVSVEHAFVTPWSRGPLRTENGPQRWVRGAVHDSDGLLVRESQRVWNGNKKEPVPADPEQVRVSRRAKRLRGTWLYAGHWSTHFGHFLLETLPNLWPDPDEYAAGLGGVIAHRQIRGSIHPGADRIRLHRPDLPSWQQQLMDLVGYGAADVHVIHGHPLRVERLLVPSRPVVLKRRAGPAAVQVWRRISEAVGDRGSASRVYLSRSRFHAGDHGRGRARTDEAQDARLDAAFSDAGFRVVHPETLPITEQIELVRGADVVAGLSGSALHLSAFAEPGTRVLTVGDRRNLGRPMPAQTMVDEACGHYSLFVRSNDGEGLARTLADLGD